MAQNQGATRRDLLKAALVLPLATGSRTIASRPSPQETEVSTVEDLMREHGVLRRVLLIYGEAIRRIERKADFPASAVGDAAGLVRRFVEDYHEKLEEQHIFPRFQKAGTLVDLVKVLDTQHQKGRAITGDIQQLVSSGLKGADRTKLAERMQAFIRMYAPHAAREDTVLFPAFKQIVSPKEYDALGDQFEKLEQQMFGQDGFEKNVTQVAGLEKQLGIYDLAEFTPKA